MATNFNISKTQVSATAADKAREEKSVWQWAPGKSLIASLRSYQRHQNSKNPLYVSMRKLAVLRHRFWSIITGADIPINCEIGVGLLLPHPNGVVIHPDAKIGPNCLIFQQVTIGYRNGGVPTLGGHVDIGAGAKLLGPINIGDHVNIGANAVVLTNVPSGYTATGIPAQIHLSQPKS
jgi:serine O-acetyltransferase